MPLKNVQNCLVVLYENEFISLSRLENGFSASIEAKGRTALSLPVERPAHRLVCGQGCAEGIASLRGRRLGLFP